MRIFTILQEKCFMRKTNWIPVPKVFEKKFTKTLNENEPQFFVSEISNRGCFNNRWQLAN